MEDSALAISLVTLGIAVLILTGVVLLVLVILIFVSVRWARGALEHWATPNPAALSAKLTHLRAQNPGLSDEELVRKVIKAEARKVGLVGALTGLGGFVTLLIGIPVDFAVSARRQAAMVHFVATIYAPDESERTLKLTTYSIMAGSGFTREAMETSNWMIQAAVRRVMTKLLAETVAESLLKIVPIIGVLVGFAFNYFATRALGHLAVSLYRARAAHAALPAAQPLLLEGGAGSSSTPALPLGGGTESTSPLAPPLAEIPDAAGSRAPHRARHPVTGVA